MIAFFIYVCKLSDNLCLLILFIYLFILIFHLF